MPLGGRGSEWPAHVAATDRFAIDDLGYGKVGLSRVVKNPLPGDPE
jgi:hypothetical protein